MTKTVFEGGGHKCLTVNTPDKHDSTDAAVIGERDWIARSHCRVAAVGERQGHMVANVWMLVGQVRTTL